MSDTAIRVPASVAGDSTDVSTALEVAGALWEKGSPDESIRWLRRAVEAAGEAGNTGRADELGSAVVELERSVGTGAAPPAAVAVSKPPPPPPAASRAPAPPGPPPPTGRPPPAPPVRTSAPPVSRAAARSVAPSSRVSAATALPIAVVPAAFAVPAGTPIRVSVKASTRDPELLVVRPLAEGRPLPPGTREGSLVLLDDEDEGRGHTNGSAVS
jgi:hypothetical protein